MEGEALRRPWRRWVSTIASVCALVIALVLMSLADVGPPAIEPVGVNQIASGPAPNHQGAGNALLPTPPTTAPVEIPPRNPAPPVQHAPDTSSSSQAQLVSLGTPNAGSVQVDGANAGQSPTTTTTIGSSSRPPVTIPGKGGQTAGIGKDKTPKPAKHKPKPEKTPKHKKPNDDKQPAHKKPKPTAKKPPTKKPNDNRKPNDDKQPSAKPAPKPAPKKLASKKHRSPCPTSSTVPLMLLLCARRSKRLPRF